MLSNIDSQNSQIYQTKFSKVLSKTLNGYLLEIESI